MTPLPTPATPRPIIHTPLPWRLSAERLVPEIKKRHYVTLMADTEVIGLTWLESDGFYVERCVNSYPALVAAVQGLLETYDGSPMRMEYRNKMIAQAQAALALATDGAGG